MKVIKNFVASDDNVNRLSEIFDEIVKKTVLLHNLDVLEFHVRDKNMAKLYDTKAMISIDYNDPFVRECDEQGMRSLILHNIYHIIIGRRYDIEIPHFVKDVLINRQMILDGYDDEVFYPMYIFLLRTKESDFHGFLKISIPWLSFYGLDNYSSDVLKDMTKRIKYDRAYEKRVVRLFEHLKKDITEESNLMHAIHMYEVMLCK